MHKQDATLPNWQQKTLGSLANYVNGRAFKPEDWGKVGLPIIRIEQINDPEAKYDFFNGIVSKDHMIENGDLLFSWSATLTTLIWNRGPAILNQHIFKVIPEENTDLHFLYHLLSSIIEDLSGHTHGSTMKHIKRSDLLPFLIDAPPLAEQRHIAEILDTIDTQIQETEKLIAKLKQMKAGLLHDLLTKGIDEHGEVRNPVAHPEQFKESALGLIPGEWTIGKLKDFYAEPARNGLYKSAKHYGKGNLMIHMPQMFRDLIIDPSDSVRVEITGAELERFSLKADDLVFARRSLNLEGAGRCSLVPELIEPTTFESSIIRVRLAKGRLRSAFANYFLNSEIGFRQRLPLIRQVAVSGVSSADIASLIIPHPSIEEQEIIIKLTQAHDRVITNEEADLNKLKQIKKGLMHDLLTGRVRVTELAVDGEKILFP